MAVKKAITEAGDKDEKAEETKKPLKITTEEILPDEPAKVEAKPPEESSLPKVTTEKPKTEPTPKEAEPVNESQEPKEETPKITSFSHLDTKTEIPSSASVEEKKEEKTEEVKTVSADISEDNSSTEDKKDMSSDEIKEWLSDVRPDTTKEMEKGGKKFNFKIVILFIIVAVIVALLAVGVMYYKNTMSAPIPASDNEAVETPAAVPVTVMEEKMEEVDYSAVDVNILNGSGIAGEAGKVEELLSDINFASTDTGNAASYDFTATVVQLKTGLSEQVFVDINEKLSSNYVVQKGDALADDNDYDVVITVGSLKPEETTAPTEE